MMKRSLPKTRGTSYKSVPKKRNRQKLKSDECHRISLWYSNVATYGDLYNKCSTWFGTALSVPIPNPHCEAWMWTVLMKSKQNGAANLLFCDSKPKRRAPKARGLRKTAEPSPYSPKRAFRFWLTKKLMSQETRFNRFSWLQATGNKAIALGS